MTEEKRPLTLDEKLDLILKYQKSAKNWAIVRAVVSISVFVVFVVLPIVGGVYLFKYVQSNVDFEKIQAQYGDFTESVNTLNAGQDKIDELLNGL